MFVPARVNKYIFDQQCTNPVRYDWSNAVIINDKSIHYNEHEACGFIDSTFVREVDEIESFSQLFNCSYREIILRMNEEKLVKTLKFFHDNEVETGLVQKLTWEWSYKLIHRRNIFVESFDPSVHSGCLCIVILKSSEDIPENITDQIQNLVYNGTLSSDDYTFSLMANYEVISVNDVADLARELKRFQLESFEEIPLSVSVRNRQQNPQIKEVELQFVKVHFLVALILYKHYKHTNYPTQTSIDNIQEHMHQIAAFALGVSDGQKYDEAETNYFMTLLMMFQQWIREMVRKNVDLSPLSEDYIDCFFILNNFVKTKVMFCSTMVANHSKTQTLVEENFYGSNNQKNSTFIYNTLFPSSPKITHEKELPFAELTSLIKKFCQNFWGNSVINDNENEKSLTDLIDEIIKQSNFFLKQGPFHKLKDNITDFMFSLMDLQKEIEKLSMKNQLFQQNVEKINECQKILQKLFKKDYLPFHKDWLKENIEKGGDFFKYLDKDKAKKWKRQLVITSIHWIVFFEQFYGQFKMDENEKINKNLLAHWTWIFNRKQEKELPEPYLILKEQRYTLAMVDTGNYAICEHLVHELQVKYICIKCKKLALESYYCPCRSKTKSFIQCLFCWKSNLGDSYQNTNDGNVNLQIIPDTSNNSKRKIIDDHGCDEETGRNTSRILLKSDSEESIASVTEEFSKICVPSRRSMISASGIQSIDAKSLFRFQNNSEMSNANNTNARKTKELLPESQKFGNKSRQVTESPLSELHALKSASQSFQQLIESNNPFGSSWQPPMDPSVEDHAVSDTDDPTLYHIYEDEYEW